MSRFTASTINDDQLDDLWDLLRLVKELHDGHECLTSQLVDAYMIKLGVAE